VLTPALNWLQALLFCWTTLCRIIWPCVPYSSRRPADEDLEIDLSLARSATCSRTRNLDVPTIPRANRAKTSNDIMRSDRARIPLKSLLDSRGFDVSPRRIICRTIRATGRSRVQMRWFSFGMRFVSKRKSPTKHRSESDYDYYRSGFVACYLLFLSTRFESRVRDVGNSNFRKSRPAMTRDRASKKEKEKEREKRLEESDDPNHAK